MDNINKYVSIECAAKDCEHNSNGMCVSESVKIGCNDEECKNNSKCETFSL